MKTKVTCINCLKDGTLGLKIRPSHGHAAEHYYVTHEDTNDACYIGTADALPHTYKEQLKTYTYFGSRLKTLG
jgi:hypothetical protein